MIHANSISDIVATVPVVMGFVPEDSYVMMSLDQQGMVLGGARIDADVSPFVLREVALNMETEVVLLFGLGAGCQRLLACAEALDTVALVPAVIAVKGGKACLVRDGSQAIAEEWVDLDIPEFMLDVDVAPSRDALAEKVAAGEHEHPPTGWVNPGKAWREVEDRAFAFCDAEFSKSVAEALFRVSQHYGARDAFIARVETEIPHRWKAICENIYATIRHYQADPMMYGMGAMIAYGFGGDGVLARTCAEHALELDEEQTTAEVVLKALDLAVNPEVIRDTYRSISLTVHRQGA